jgi:hypothetical protein
MNLKFINLLAFDVIINTFACSSTGFETLGKDPCTVTKLLTWPTLIHGILTFVPLRSTGIVLVLNNAAWQAS